MSPPTMTSVSQRAKLVRTAWREYVGGRVVLGPRISPIAVMISTRFRFGWFPGDLAASDRSAPNGIQQYYRAMDADRAGLDVQSLSPNDDDRVRLSVSVVLPCLDEAASVGLCVAEALETLRGAGFDG